jgi:hypothetical protein
MPTFKKILKFLTKFFSSTPSRPSRRRKRLKTVGRRLKKTKTRQIKNRISSSRRFPSRKSSRKKIKPSKRVKSRRDSTFKRKSVKKIKKIPARTSHKKGSRRALGRSSLKESTKENKVNEGVYIGDITHFFSRIEVVVLRLTSGNIHIGDRIRIQSKSGYFEQTVTSLQVESLDVKDARRGQLVGLKVNKPAKVGDRVFIVK